MKVSSIKVGIIWGYKTLKLIVNDLKKVYGTSTPLTATLLNDDDTSAVGVSVSFFVNGVYYSRITNSEGIAKLNINLPVGNYTCTVQVQSSLSKTVSVRVVDRFFVSLLVNPLTKTYGVAGGLKAILYSENAEPLAGRIIQYKINGVIYKRVTNNDGQTNLAINLRPGVYPCEVKFIGDAEYGASSTNVDVTVKADTFIDGTDVDKKYSDAGYFQCAVYDQWERLNPVTVTLTVNGVSYTRTSDKNGLVKLNIRLQPGEYALTVRFDGDVKHNGSSLTKLVKVRPDIDGITTKTPDGYTIPSNNRGFIESKIYATAFPYDANKKNNWIYDNPDWNVLTSSPEMHAKIQFTSYEITETDGRVKTAKFTTNRYLDLTQGRIWVYITSPYHENFGGRILKIDYDKNTGLYTYQCQDGRRQYISKRRFRGGGSVYQILELLLLHPVFNKKGGISGSVSAEDKKKHAKLFSGLHPIEDYDNLKLSPILKGGNPFKQNVSNLLAYDSVIDLITNLAKNGQYPIDVWFDPSGVCHIDPIDLDKWLNQGIRLVHSDLISYKYGFDTTNILTGITLKSKDEPNASGHYDEWSELTYFFGSNFGAVDPVTTTTSSTGTTTSSDTSSTSSTTSTTTNTNTVSSGLMSGKKTFAVGQDSGVVPHYRLTLINKLRAAGHTVIDLGVGPNKNQSFGQSSRAKGVIDIFVCNGICCGTHHDYMLGMKSGNYKYSHVIFTWVRGDIEMSRKQNYAWDWYYGDIGLDKTITRHEFFVRYKDKMSYVNLWPDGNGSFPLSTSDWEKQCDAIVAGKFNNNSNGVVSSASSSTGTTSSSNTTTTVVDTVATYNKALEAVSQSVRDLLSFEIELPLNNPVFKNLHTNMMLWTELPKEFRLINLEKIFKILPSYKVNRGVPYQENRWYVEKVNIKHDGKGPIAKITLNPFPSNYSVYSNAVKGYVEAYDQAFKQNTTTENTSSTSTSATAGSAEQIFKEVASICEKYSYSLGWGVSSYSAMKRAGHGDCWAFAELVYEELKARGVNAIIWTYATSAASNHRSAGYQASDGSWKNFPYRTYVTNPKRCKNGGNNWYFDFSRPSGASVIKKWTGGKGI